MPLSATTIEAVLGASKRSAAVVHEEMRDGLTSLASIAALAPWIGLLGTTTGIVGAFSSLGHGSLAGSLSDSLFPTALGLIVALISLWCYRYLAASLETVDIEMQKAPLQLLNQLASFRGQWQLAPAGESAPSRPMFGEQLPASKQDRRFWYVSMFLSIAAILVSWCLGASRWSGYWPFVLFAFTVSCFPAHAIWVKLLHRRRGGMVLVAAAICLCWSVAEFVLSL
jgi:hypothetical protein